MVLDLIEQEKLREVYKSQGWKYFDEVGFPEEEGSYSVCFESHYFSTGIETKSACHYSKNFFETGIKKFQNPLYMNRRGFFTFDSDTYEFCEINSPIIRWIKNSSIIEF